MCVVLQHHLGKGARCAPPLHPPGHGSFRALNPFQSQKIVSPINHSQGLEKCLSTCSEPCTNVWPSDHQSGERSCSPRYPHDQFMETNPARIGCRHLAEDGPLLGVYRYPKPSSLDLEKCLSTNTEPCTNGRPFDPRHAVKAMSWRRLHRDQSCAAWIRAACLYVRMSLDYANTETFSREI